MPKSKSLSKEAAAERNPYLPPGLINHGNTCFMNSVLQGLIATKLLHDLVTFSPITPDLQPTLLFPSRSPQLTNGHGVAGQYEQKWDGTMPIGDQFVKVMVTAWVAQSDRSRGLPLSPKPLLTALGKKYQQYCDFAQQDAHEFLRILLDAIRMEEMDVIKRRQPPPKSSRKPRKRKRARDRVDTTTTPNDTPTDTHPPASLLPFPDMLFAGQLTSILVCRECKRVSQTYEDFYDISLSINPEDYVAPSSASFNSPPFGTAAHFFANSFKNVGKGKAKETKEEREKEAAEGEAQPKLTTTATADAAGGQQQQHPKRGHERKRDKFRKLARRIAGVTTPTQVNASEVPRASSVPPEERGIGNKDKDIAIAKAAGGLDVLRRTRSRSLDHVRRIPSGLLAAADAQPPEVAIRESSETGEGGEPREQDQASSSGGEGNYSSTGRDETMTALSAASETVESDWSVVREGDVTEVVEEKVDEAVVVVPTSNRKKEKKKEGDSWTKLSKRISLSVGLSRNSNKEKDREGDREKERGDGEAGRPLTRSQTRDFMNAMLVDIRAKRKSRESSPDPAGFALASGRKPKPPEVPPLPRPATAPSAHLSPPPRAHHHHHQQHHSDHAMPSPLSHQAFQSPHASSSLQEEKDLPEIPSLLESASSTTLNSSPLSHFTPSTRLSTSRSHKPSKSQDTARPLPIHTKHRSRRPRSPTPAELEYLNRILGDVDVSDSKSSPTPSGGWPAPTTSPYSLVNPFALLIKSGGAKNKAAAGHEANNEGPAAAVATGEADPRQGSASSTSNGGKWPSWWGINRLSGLEECLRLFTSVEVLDYENKVGCRRCWKIANQDKEEEEQGREGGDERNEDNGEDEDGEDDDDDDESSSDDERSPRAEEFPPLLPNLPVENLPAQLMDLSLHPSHDTPGGMPIPIISEPESLFEPSSTFAPTPTRSRFTHPLRSNSADFVSLSALSLREAIRLDTDNLPSPSLLVRNASSPSITSGLSSPASPYSPSSTAGVNVRNSLGIPRASSTRRHARIWPSTDGESDDYESGSAVESSRSGGEGEGGDFLDVDDGLSIGSSSSMSVPPSAGPSTSVSENDVSERSLIDEGISVPEEGSTMSSAAASVDAISAGEPQPEHATEAKKKAKPPRKPKPVIMRSAYKRYLISTAPPVLVIHLKRFQQMLKAPLISFTSTYGFKKLDDYVTFPEYLDLTPFLAPRKEDWDGGPPGKSERCLYRLYAVVVHIGNMLGGHYIAYTAVPDQPPTRPDTTSSSGSSTSESGSPSMSSNVVIEAPPLSTRSQSKSGRPERRWAYVSDMSVRLASLEEVLKARAYICMYERI